MVRILRCRLSTHSYESWPQDVCCRLSTSAPGVSLETPSVTTGWQAQFTPTSQVPSVDMQVRQTVPFCRLRDPLDHPPPDVLVHRQLAASIGCSPLHATLHSKGHVERSLEVINRRHRMAQMAGRASIEFYVGLALKGRGEKSIAQEEAFVVRTFRNGLGVFVSKYVRPFVKPGPDLIRHFRTVQSIDSGLKVSSCSRENQNTTPKTTS